MSDDGNNDSPMQAQLGLTSGTSSMSPFGFMTPPPMPYVRHPGEASQDAAMRFQTQAAQTMQSAMMNRPGVLSTGAMGGFAQQYSANMATMNQQMFNPFVAQTMASMSGSQGFSPGMMPSPVSMTMPNMGNYRSNFQSPMSTFPPTPPMPLIPTPFTPNMPHPSFSTPMDFGYNQAHYRGIQQTSAFTAAPGIAARGMADLASSYVGGGIGALVGSKIGGARGAMVGSTVGSLAGLIGGEAGGFGAAAQRMTDHFNPFQSIYAQSQQLQTGSTGYVVGGSDLSVSGRGLSGNASRHLATQMRQFSRSMPSSGDSFTNSDMIKMTQMAGENGMLNMSQNTDQIVNQMKTVAKSMKVFMQLAGEPDMRAAMKSMGQLYAMGVSVPEMTGLAQNAKMYSKMAGTSFQGIMQSGLAGAEIFQSQGLTAGLGMNVGMGSMGMAQQAVAGGAYSPQLLAMQGGVQGIAQREMMSQAATLKMPMMAMAAANFSGGAFGMNAGAAHGMAGGQFNMGQLATMGANNMMQAVNKGGVGAMGLYALQQPMIQDQMGRELGPMGLKNMGFQNVIQNMKMLGLSGAGGFATVATSLYGKETATDMVAQGSSPEFMANMQRQLDVQRNDLRGQAKAKLEGSRGGFFERNLGITPLRKQAWFQRLGDSADELMENVTSAFDFTEENAAEANGQQLDRVSTRLLASSPQERGHMAKLDRGLVAREMREITRDAEARTDRGAFGYNRRGEAYGSAIFGRSEELQDQYAQVTGQTGFMDRLGNRLVTDKSKMQSTIAQADQTGRVVSRAMSVTGAQYTEASDRLSKAGITSEQRGNFVSILSHLASGTRGAMTNQHREAASAALGRDATEEEANDMLMAGGGLAKAAAGPENVGLFTAHAAGGTDASRHWIRTATDRREKMLSKVMGDKGSGDAREKAMAILYKDGDPNAAAVAALTVAGDATAVEAFLEKIPDTKQREAARIKGAAIAELINARGNEQLRDPVKAFAKTLQRGGTIGAESQATHEALLQGKEAVGAKKGLASMGLDPSLATGDMGAALEAVYDKKSLAGGNARIERLAKKYHDAESPKERSAIEAELGRMGAARGAVSGTSQEGGVRGDEAMNERLQNDLGLNSEQLQKIFKDGSPLDRSAVQLDYAANKLLDAATALNNR